MFTPYRINEKISIENMFSFFEYHYDKNYSFGGETHDFWECVFVKSGKICVSGDERVYNLYPGEIIFHKPLELHKFDVKDPNGADLVIFSFSAIGVLVDFFKNKVFYLSEKQQLVINMLLEYINNKFQYNYETLQSLSFFSLFEKIPTFSQIISNQLQTLFLLIYEDNAISAVSDKPDAMIFKKAVSCMKHNLDKQLTIEYIAHFCSTSPTCLKRIFFKYSSLGVHKYFLKMKINIASQYLKDEISVTEISERLGFASQGYFSHAFKRETGFSPSEYKNTDLL